MEQQNQMIAVCGLPCYICDILRSSNNPEMAQQVADELRHVLNMEKKPEEIHCAGCKGDRSEHWSPECWILRCCVDDKGLEFCYECVDFPCEKLKEWANEREAYGKALERLKRMKEGKI